MKNTIGNKGATEVPHSLIPGAIAMQQEQHFFLKEMSFTQSARFSFGADEVKWFLIDPTSYTPDEEQVENRIILQVPAFFAAAGPIEVDFYSGPTLGAAVATPIAPPPFNRIGASARAAQLEISTLNVAPSSLGTLFSELLVPANATGVGQQTGFSTVEALPFGLDVTTPILMTVKNTNGAGTHVGIRNGWFEV